MQKLIAFLIFIGIIAYVIFRLDILNRYYTNSCEDGNVQSCMSIANKYYDKKEYEKSIYYYDKSCTLGQNESCYTLSIIYGDKEFGFYNEQREQEYLNKSNYNSLSSADTFYEKERNNTSAFNISDYAAAIIELCKADNPHACFEAGNLYSKGEGVEKDIETANKYYLIACRNNELASCRDLHIQKQ